MFKSCKRFFFLSLALFLCSLVVYAAAALGSLPEHIFLAPEHVALLGDRGGRVSLSFSPWLEEESVPAAFQGDAPVIENIDREPLQGEMTVSLLGIPLRNVAVDLLRDVEVIPVGITVGIRIDATGLIVLGTGAVTTSDGSHLRPSEGLIKSGDILLKVNNTEIQDQNHFSSQIESTPPGSSVSLTLRRGEEIITVEVSPVLSSQGRNKLGLWIRDSTKGIGTITYYNPVNSRFAALGHGVVDVDTNQLIPVRDGQLYQADIVAVKRGKKGSPGELVGNVDRDSPIGVITSNTSVGLFGTIKDGSRHLPGKTMGIALQGDVREGPAVILSNISGREVRQYDIFIERVNRFASDESKGMVIRITDQELITRTNGIVQGMSGSPIIQNGRLVGAVTHVLVQNPLRGYGIFIENMLRQERNQ